MLILPSSSRPPSAPAPIANVSRWRSVRSALSSHSAQASTSTGSGFSTNGKTASVIRAAPTAPKVRRATAHSVAATATRTRKM